MGLALHGVTTSSIPVVNSYQELNQLLLDRCLNDDNRTVDGQATTIGAAWALEKTHLLPLPREDFRCCVTDRSR